MKPFPKKIVKEGASVSQPGNGNGNGKGTLPTDPVKDVSTAGATVNKEVKEPAKESTKDEKKTATVNRTETKASEKAGDNGKGKAKIDTPPLMSEAQKRAVYNLSRRRGSL